jgi:hypothetical protein
LVGVAVKFFAAVQLFLFLDGLEKEISGLLVYLLWSLLMFYAVHR